MSKKTGGGNTKISDLEDSVKALQQQMMMQQFMARGTGNDGQSTDAPQSTPVNWTKVTIVAIVVFVVWKSRKTIFA